MSDTVPVDVVRVFTDEDGGFGNQLGIVRSTEKTRGREQQIARGLGFSETVFVEDVVDGSATIRIFTPAKELPFAGHPSVGVAWWLAAQGTPVGVLLEKAGDVAVRHDGDLTWISGRASWAREWEWMPMAAPEEVDALDAAGFATGSHYAYAWIDEAAGRLRARMFAPEMGTAEDEATGAAAVAITARIGRDLSIEQGAGSRIATRLAGDGVIDVGGRTVHDRTIAF